MPLLLSTEQKQNILWISLWLAVLFFLLLLGPVLAPFVASAILAYVLNPGVDRLTRMHVGKFRMPRVLAVLIIISLLGAALLTVILIVVPVLHKEILLLQERLPLFLTRLNESISPRLREFGIQVQLDGTGLKRLLSEKIEDSDAIWATILNSARAGGSVLLSWISALILIPVALFYLLLDWHALLNRLTSAIPRRWVNKVVAMSHEVDDLMAQYLRGQLLVMLILAAYYSIGLLVAGFEIALPVGIITGLLVFIPYLGFGLGLVLAIIAALLQFSTWYGLIWVAVIYGIGQIVESFVLTPQLVGERIGLHPLAVIFALLAFAQLFGFVGILLALPASAILMVLFKHLRTLYLESSFYQRSQ